MKNIKIVLSFDTPPLEVAENLVIMPVKPFSEEMVTVLINPGIAYYKEREKMQGADIGHLTLAGATDETTQLTFDFKDNNIHKIKTKEKNFELKLMNISREKVKENQCPCFEFFLTGD